MTMTCSSLLYLRHSFSYRRCTHALAVFAASGISIWQRCSCAAGCHSLLAERTSTLHCRRTLWPGSKSMRARIHHAAMHFSCLGGEMLQECFMVRLLHIAAGMSKWPRSPLYRADPAPRTSHGRLSAKQNEQAAASIQVAASPLRV